MGTRPNWLEAQCFEGNEKEFPPEDGPPRSLLGPRQRSVSHAGGTGERQSQTKALVRLLRPGRRYCSISDKRTAKEFSVHEQRMSQTARMQLPMCSAEN